MPLDDPKQESSSAPTASADETDLELCKLPVLADENMLAYFLSALEVRAKLLKQLLPAESPKQQIVAEVRHKIAAFHERCPLVEEHRWWNKWWNESWNRGRCNWRNLAWCDAYRLELLLALAEPKEKLVPELEQRLDEADEEKVPSAPRLRQTYSKTIAETKSSCGVKPEMTAGVEAILRSQLVNVIEETQWHIKRKFTARTIQKEATYKIIAAAIVSFGLFMSPYTVIIARYAVSWPNTLIWINDWVGLSVITALTAGLFGAFFSRLLFIQSSWRALSFDELKAAREMSSIILRGTVGMCGAVVVYFILHANLISGALVPDFSGIGLISLPDSQPQLILPNRELALLALWSFLAGFSERLVPNILVTTEATLGKGSSEAKPPGN